MKKIPITLELLNTFRTRAETLIMEGYCKFLNNVSVYVDNDSYATVYVDASGSEHCCLYNASESFINDIIGVFKGKAVEFCAVSPNVTEYLRKKYLFTWETNCDLFVWNGESLPHKCCRNLAAMDGAYARQISDGTFYHASEEEIARCLEAHPSSAAYVNGKPVCWCLLHMEGSLGMLYTLPEYRHQGYALEVMTDITNKVIDSGNIPFAYIVKNNIASQNLAGKYNLIKVGEADYFEVNLSSPQN